jgi:8-oxo-dGTP pyrophosphatase MutT (NUDIX family)
MTYRNPVDDFERRVEGLRAFHQGGGSSAPLLVNFSGGKFQLNDGNHRHEALVRDGVTAFPMIFWTTGDPDKQGLLDTLGPWLEIGRLYNEGLAQGRQGVVGCLVVRPDGRLFAQRRSPSRRTFPGCWDLVGGHIESGESPYQALTRELAEETDWELDRVLGLRRVVDWETLGPDGGQTLKREFVVAVTIRGRWDQPVLEAGKATEGRWFGPEDGEVLNENRTGTDTYVYDLFRAEFGQSAGQTGGFR